MRLTHDSPILALHAHAQQTCNSAASPRNYKIPHCCAVTITELEEASDRLRHVDGQLRFRSRSNHKPRLRTSTSFSILRFLLQQEVWCGSMPSQALASGAGSCCTGRRFWPQGVFSLRNPVLQWAWLVRCFLHPQIDFYNPYRLLFTVHRGTSSTGPGQSGPAVPSLVAATLHHQRPSNWDHLCRCCLACQLTWLYTCGRPRSPSAQHGCRGRTGIRR